MKPKGYYCSACQAQRLHAIESVQENESKDSRVYYVRTCMVCEESVPLALHEQPGLCCPKCLDIRIPAYSTAADFKTKKLPIVGAPALQSIPVRRRVRECRHCKHRFRCIELLEALFG